VIQKLNFEIIIPGLYLGIKGINVSQGLALAAIVLNSIGLAVSIINGVLGAIQGARDRLR
jgi:hypothetical protein